MLNKKRNSQSLEHFAFVLIWHEKVTPWGVAFSDWFIFFTTPQSCYAVFTQLSWTGLPSQGAKMLFRVFSPARGSVRRTRGLSTKHIRFFAILRQWQIQENTLFLCPNDSSFSIYIFKFFCSNHNFISNVVIFFPFYSISEWSNPIFMQKSFYSFHSNKHSIVIH